MGDLVSGLETFIDFKLLVKTKDVSAFHSVADINEPIVNKMTVNEPIVNKMTVIRYMK